MATSSPFANLPRPSLSDPPNAEAAFVNLTNALDPIVIPKFTSGPARDLKIPSPTDGQHAFLTDSHTLYVYKADLGEWVPYSYARLPEVVRFDANSNWTKPAGARTVWVRVQGGGGAGGGAVGGSGTIACGGSGGAGGFSESWYNADDLTSSVSITIGAGGSGTVGGNGGNGGVSQFGSYMTANGGTGGQVGAATTGTNSAGAGVGGTASGGNQTNFQGENGNIGQVLNGSATFFQRGGSSALGSGGAAAVTTSGNGDPARGWGSGGGNALANTTSRAGGAGSQGTIIVITFF